MSIIDLIEKENGIIKVFEKSLSDNMDNLRKPNCIYFTSWTFAQVEGKLIQAWKATAANGIEKDDDRLRFGRIWSFIFPEFREDYLVERTWTWMLNESNNTCHTVLIHRLDPPITNNSMWEIYLKEDFIKNLGGDILQEKIKKHYNETTYKDLNEIDRCLKTARNLKYNEEFNKDQIEGINKAFSFWVNKKDITTTENLNSLFKYLYKKDDPALYSLEAKKFLTIWQNFSVLFPEFPHIIVYFEIPDPYNHPEFRYAIALCYDTVDDKLPIVLTYLKPIMKNMHDKFLSELISQLKSKSTLEKVDETGSDSNWLRVKQKYRSVIESVINRDFDKLDKLIELVGQLSFSTHEARPCKFAFIAGSEQIWPSIEEIISLEFCNLKLFRNDEFDADLFAKLCEANYSVFQINGVVGFFNTDLQSMYKIIRLHTPSKDELRKTGNYINDYDDLFCWAIDKIYEETEFKSFLVFTNGDGKVQIYGLLKSSNEADLLLIWDVRKGEIKLPIEIDITNEIRKELEKIGIKDNIKFNNIIKAIRKISASLGEGAALIIARRNRDVEKYLATMELLIPTWLCTIGLDDPEYLLKAAFILDGACLVTSEKVTPRLAIYPHNKKHGECRAFGLLEDLKNKVDLNDEDKDRILDLSGRGSKTHAACNLINVPDLKGKCIMITISADGPVRIWK